jgi:uncharacterized phage-associated protein
MHKPETIAKYLLHLAAQAPEPCPITHMQLQKLLYYVQGWSLAWTGKAMFRGEIQAWEHGPVVADLYPRLKKFKARPLPLHRETGAEALSREERGMIESVWGRYGQYSAPHLREMTHKERPWKEARGSLAEGAKSQAVIPEESMRAYFRKEYEEWCRKHMGCTPEELEQSVKDARSGNTTPLELPRRTRGTGRVAG